MSKPLHFFVKYPTYVNRLYNYCLVVLLTVVTPNPPQQKLEKADVGVYLIEENKFTFNYVIVGQKASARFKISNTRMV